MRFDAIVMRSFASGRGGTRASTSARCDRGRARARGGAGTAGDGARVGAGWVAVVDVGVERGEREL